MEKTFEQIRTAICNSVSDQPDTHETRAASISVLLMLASGLAEQEPREVRQHWAKEFYKHADRLAE